MLSKPNRAIPELIGKDRLLDALIESAFDPRFRPIGSLQFKKQA
jgi:hypothetical protein